MFRIVLTFALVTVASAQSWVGVLAPARAINWNNAGAGALPVRNTICSTLNPGATRAQINTAIAGCPATQVVFLTAGTYNLTDYLFFDNKSGVTLRCAGANQTFLVFGAGTTIGAIYAANSDTNNSAAPHNVATWTGGYGQSVTSITLGAVTTGSISNLHVGSLLILDQLDDASDPGNIFICQNAGVCSTGSNPAVGRAGRGQMQQVTVTSITGTGPWTVGITPGLYAPNWRSGQTPGAWWSNAPPATGIGIEDCSFDVSASTAGFNGVVFFHNVTSSWVKGIRSINNVVSGAAKKHVQFYQSSHNTVRDSYFYGSAGASESYGVDSSFGSSDNLVENNIFQHVATATIREGDCGTVFGYNYAVDNFYTSGGGNFQQGDAYSHAIADCYGLWEGNVGSELELDDINGTHFMHTAFRNYWSGCDATGSGAGCGGGVKSVQTGALEVNAGNRYMNLVGNVLGRTGYHTDLQCAAAATGTNCATDGNKATISLGFSGLHGLHGTFNNDLVAVSSAMRWGNYSACSGTGCNVNRFDATEDGHLAPVYPALNPASQVLPASFYISLKPLWWGTMPWPGIGPDVMSGPGPGGHAYQNPAQNCYLTIMGGLTNGTSVALAFDRVTCYATVRENHRMQGGLHERERGRDNFTHESNRRGGGLLLLPKPGPEVEAATLDHPAHGRN